MSSGLPKRVVHLQRAVFQALVQGVAGCQFQDQTQQAVGLLDSVDCRDIYLEISGESSAPRFKQLLAKLQESDWAREAKT